MDHTFAATGNEHDGLVLAALEQLTTSSASLVLPRLATSMDHTFAASLRQLDDVVPRASGTLEYALAAVDRGYVVRLEGPSGRYVHSVASSFLKNPAKSHDIIASGVSADGNYTCIGGYCSCAEYKLGLEAAAFFRFCKHLLAVRIAEATKNCATRRVTDVEVARLLDMPYISAV